MSAHCCEMMRENVENVCDQHADRHDCPDCPIDFWPQSGLYGIMIHDGGSSMITIAYCPWCGIKLPEQSAADD
ncbi:hypothetical protein K9B35_06085 [Sphingomonas sp. R647]|uniref:DUF6980 family protein n=1 Tax=Sphingomonas sp. R647 TaxID=2875233 RepID=UPI001CD21E67|nr:hypothetical protein [Sphingomonas sp. R647]MCA1197527.1 hypothetical protein [Sphingomonas sp. R647]